MVDVKGLFHIRFQNPLPIRTNRPPIASAPTYKFSRKPETQSTTGKTQARPYKRAKNKEPAQTNTKHRKSLKTRPIEPNPTSPKTTTTGTTPETTTNKDQVIDNNQATNTNKDKKQAKEEEKSEEDDKSLEKNKSQGEKRQAKTKQEKERGEVIPPLSHKAPRPALNTIHPKRFPTNHIALPERRPHNESCDIAHEEFQHGRDAVSAGRF